METSLQAKSEGMRLLHVIEKINRIHQALKGVQIKNMFVQCHCTFMILICSDILIQVNECVQSGFLFCICFFA
ncbi:hypothetical protein Barb7_00043 [Bacteroidales bacterium Barb7]|nr:hypothetical protein Barb7_00056 [Bacteroidales bacterium Barb7]OAV76291.1 hypothetical protein Barb7_00005 [Bacteroidales bacterium Barb7]OAV76329.1 hypothetical protein Barb7_00043 [Bacteroidales bacterium Barb7]